MIPARLLRDLTLRTPVYDTDAYGATVSDGTPTETTITGRIDQTGRREDLTRNRQAALSDWLLLTNSAAVAANCQIVDGLTVFDVVGDPWPVYGRSGVHHYEATLRISEG